MSVARIYHESDLNPDAGLTEAELYKRDREPFMKYSHREAARARLIELGFDSLPTFALTPGAEPITVCTGVSFAKFDPRKHLFTPTKEFYEPSGNEYLLNQSASVAVRLLDEKKRVIVFTSPSAAESTRELIDLHPQGFLASVVGAEFDQWNFVETLYVSLAEQLSQSPASRVDLVIYDSFMPYLSKHRADRPFVPVYEEKVEDMQRMVSGRIAFLHWVGQIVYDLALNKEQQEIRLILITSLASRRAAGNLYVDALHKGVSTIFLETLTKEIIQQGICEKFYGIEPAPGVVDRGAYDILSVRQATIENSLINGFPYQEVDENAILSFPQMSPRVFGELCALYLDASEGEDVTRHASPELLEVLSAGRSLDEVEGLLSHLVRECPLGLDKQRQGYERAFELGHTGLPSYLLASKCIGKLPPFEPGFTFIPMSPKGQLF